MTVYDQFEKQPTPEEIEARRKQALKECAHSLYFLYHEVGIEEMLRIITKFHWSHNISVKTYLAMYDL